jgi:site-specific DNA-cytosine methylase
VSPREAVGDRKVGLMWLSPDCKHFSKAKGGKPVEKKIRGLAWVAYRWAKEVRPSRVIALENVEEFADWGPLGADGKPCPLRKGFTFRRFVAMLSEPRLRPWTGASSWPRTTARPRRASASSSSRAATASRSCGRSRRTRRGRHGLQPWRTAAECIDFTLPCPSIFLTPAEAKVVGVKRPLAENTMRRIARGLQKFVLDNPKPFIVGGAGRGEVPRRQRRCVDRVAAPDHHRRPERESRRRRARARRDRAGPHRARERDQPAQLDAGRAAAHAMRPGEGWTFRLGGALRRAAVRRAGWAGSTRAVAGAAVADHRPRPQRRAAGGRVHGPAQHRCDRPSDGAAGLDHRRQRLYAGPRHVQPRELSRHRRIASPRTTARAWASRLSSP